MDDWRETHLGEIDRAIVDSCNKLGGINRSNLPSREGVVAILEEFESLLFPGFQTEEELDDDKIYYTIGSKTQRLRRYLTLEISRGLQCIDQNERCPLEADNYQKHSETLAHDILSSIPRLRHMAMEDVDAALSGDPAAKSREEVILSYPGLMAIVCHRIAHEIHSAGIPLIPRMMSEFVHSKSGIDIHPAAEIGPSFFIDHGTGVVIGETSVIGKNVKIYQGVTIGALSVSRELAEKKRHPTIEDDVTIYAEATILGGNTVIGKGSVIGGNTWITKSIPPYTIVSNPPVNIRMKNRMDSKVENWII